MLFRTMLLTNWVPCVPGLMSTPVPFRLPYVLPVTVTPSMVTSSALITSGVCPAGLAFGGARTDSGPERVRAVRLRPSSP